MKSLYKKRVGDVLLNVANREKLLLDQLLLQLMGFSGIFPDGFGLSGPFCKFKNLQNDIQIINKL